MDSFMGTYAHLFARAHTEPNCVEWRYAPPISRPSISATPTTTQD